MKQSLQLICAFFLLIASACAYAEASDEFYSGLGGKEGVRKLAAQLVQLAQQDPRLKAQFAEIDAPHLTDMLAEQFCQLSGGPCTYSGKSMEVIHDGMKITTAQFNALAEDLQLAMTMQAIPNSIQNKLIAKLAPMQRQIVRK